eukprot:Skav233880  [mRNA]  locus=scaffold435:51283:55734:- [translate_table: standard]
MKEAIRAGWGDHLSLGIEMELNLAAQHSINHGSILVPDQPLPPTWFHDQKTNITLQANIHDLKSIQALACYQADIWTASAPCQPWSSAASAKGFDDGHGLSFAKLLSLARRMRPKLIALENVKNIRSHQHFVLLCQIIHWSGYRIAFEKVLDVQDKLPCHRPRWIAVLCRVEDPLPEFTWQSWGGIEPANPLSWDAWIPTHPDELMLFLPTKEEMQMYMDKDLIPAHAPYYAAYNLMRYRMPPLQQKTPTFMAQYGSQHRLPLPLLQSKGLQGFLTYESWKPRFWKPIEVSLLHLQCEPLALLKPVQLAWKSLGNSIVIHHAFVGLVNAFALMYDMPDGFNMECQLKEITERRITNANHHHVTDEYGWCIAKTQEQAELMNSKIHHMSKTMGWTGHDNPTWPPHSYYHPDKGCCDVNTHALTPDGFDIPAVISATLPFEAELDIEVDDTVLDSADPTMDTHADGHIGFHTQEQKVDLAIAQHLAHCTQTIMAKDLPDLPPSPSQADETMLETQRVQQDDCLEHDWITMVLFLIPGTYGIIQFHDELTFGDVLQSWEFKLYPQALANQHVTVDQLMKTKSTKTILFPAWLAQQELGFDEDIVGNIWDSIQDLPDSPIALVDTNTGTYAIKVNGSTWETLCARYHEFPEQVWTDWGEVLPNQVIRTNVRLCQQPIPVQTFFGMSDFLEHHDDIHLIFQTPNDTDILVVHMEGTLDALAVITTLWRIALDDLWQELHARQVTYQVIDQNNVRFVIRPTGRRASTPVVVLRHAIGVRLAKSLLQAMHVHDAPYHMQIKDEWGVITTLGVKHRDQIPDVFRCLQHAYFFRAHGETPRLVSQGKQIFQESLLEDVFARKPDIKAHVIMPIRGGGGARQDHRKAVHSLLAGMLVEHELPLDTVPKAVEKLQTQYGIPKLTHVLFATSSDEKTKQFREMCKHANIQISDVGTPVDAVRQKFQKIQSKKPAPFQMIDPMQYALLPGFFKTGMGEAMTITKQFSPCVSAVTMLTATEAEPWISTNISIHTDEKAVFVIGNLPKTNCTYEKIVAPASNLNGQQCLLAGYLVQLGERPVKHNQDDDHITCHDVRVCSFTLWASDWADDTWKLIQDAPVKQTKRILETDGSTINWTNPFGRTYHRDQKPCSPAEANSIQFHAEVKMKELRQLLRHSGFNGVFIVPKSDQGKPSEAWRVVWVDLPPKRIETIAMGQQGVAGLVKGRKNFGVRCEPKHFDAMWKLFHADAEPPQQIPDGTWYKVQNLPYGVDKAVLTEWLESCGWKAHPLKSIGSRTWILKSPDAPPRDLLCFNSAPVIVKRMADRQPAATGLIAGPRSNPAATNGPQDGKHPNYFKMGDPFMDPWSPPQTSSASTGVTTTPAGPTMTHLTKHDQQIAALEDALQQVQHAQQSNATQLDNRLNQVETSLQHHTEATAKAMADLRSDFQQSFKDTMEHQDKQIQSRLKTSVDEIKELFFRAEKRKQKERKAEADEDDSM